MAGSTEEIDKLILDSIIEESISDCIIKDYESIEAERLANEMMVIQNNYISFINKPNEYNPSDLLSDLLSDEE